MDRRIIGGVYIQKKTYPCPYDKIFEASLRSLKELGWKLISHDRTSGEIRAQTGVTLRSWGEDISIHVSMEAAETAVSVLSKASFQIFDWWKNEENEKAFHEEMEKIISR